VATEILQALAPGAILVNFDRGEIIDVNALDSALSCGTVGSAVIDADVFLGGGEPSGPLAPYLPLASRYSGRLLLLPHAAADTDHPSRVAGAKLAVDMIFDLLTTGRVYNLVGDLPVGLVNGGPRTPKGIGKVTEEAIRGVADDRVTLTALATRARELADFYEALLKADDAMHVELTLKTASRAIEAGDFLCSRLNAAGLLGPFRS
jgi:hypothetical protein